MTKLGWALILLTTVAVLATATALEGAPFGNEMINYTYDGQGRLTNVAHSGSVNSNLQANYTYDKVGNRNTVKVTGAP